MFHLRWLMLSSSMGLQAIHTRSPNRGKPATPAKVPIPTNSSADREQMAALVAFTLRSMLTDNPRPFGASVVHTKSGKLLLRALNAVKQQCDPSAHAEVRAIRLATSRLSTTVVFHSIPGKRTKARA
jgi:hypothetical protein